MAGKYYTGDVGTDIILDCGEDITGATATKIKYKKPDNSTGEWIAGVYNINYLKYTIQSGDLDQAGLWKFQVSLTLGSWSGLGETAEQIIYAAYE